MADPEDFLYEASEFLYGHGPVAPSSAGSLFTHHPRNGGPSVTVMTPDTQTANWSLHATSIWSAAIYVVDHIDDFCIGHHYDLIKHEGRPLRVLELGAGAGLPGIFIAKKYPHTMVTSSDYPDELLIRTLAANAKRNDVEDRCRVVPYAWGSDPAPLLQSQNADSDPIPGFDVVIAADTLWNRDTHQDLVRSLQTTLKRCPHARIYVVAGLHTGRYVIHTFYKHALGIGLLPEELNERRVDASKESQRLWWPDRADDLEDEPTRRRWVAWAVFKWARGAQ
ncbi:putative methyltransferase-domain-containing protein [Dichomitus squalens]|nr:putative methyltransferase-domain-containing protein [Dichomitus squalens]